MMDTIKRTFAKPIDVVIVAFTVVIPWLVVIAIEGITVLTLSLLAPVVLLLSLLLVVLVDIILDKIKPIRN